jgi:uncharacterized protein YdaU (DUF1376 family)
VNYYEHHLGDYMRDTAHLSMLEDGAYRRLLDVFYIREKALPTDLRECCKLARATSKPERDAVAYVLREFFEPREDGYHQRRADTEIAHFQDKQRKAKASADARWSQYERNANASPNAHATGMRTHSERNANGMHRAPVPSPQSPDTSNQSRNTGKKNTSAHSALSDIDPKIVADWLAHRKARKAAVSDTAIEGIRREAERAGMTLQDALAMSCQRGWTGFKAEWVSDPRGSGGNASVSAAGAATARSSRALEERLFGKEENIDAT